jgi:DNA-binding LytR/AlgR family response regulator
MPNSASLSDRAPGVAEPIRIAIRLGGKVVFIESTEVIAFEGRGNHVLVRTCSRLHSARESVSKVEEKLRPYGFLRIHRSTIVNGALVEEVWVSRSGAMRLRVKGVDKDYKVSRTYRPFVNRLAPAWI